MKRIVLLLWVIGFAFPLQAQNQKTPSPLIFIYDASRSMWGQIEGTSKMEIASSVLIEAVNKLPDNQKIGLVAYGHRKKTSCTDVEFLVDVSNKSKPKVTNKLKALRPLGRTPLAYSATVVIDQLRASKKKATIILVTDGIESCDGDLCDVIRSAKKEGIKFKLHIVGFGLKEGETKQLECAAKEGGGDYYDAADEDGLGDVLEEVTSVDDDGPDGNFSVYATRNGEGIDALVEAYRSGSNTLVASTRTYKDTSSMFLPTGTYNMIAKALENSDVKAISYTDISNSKGKMDHLTVSFDSGKLNVNATNNGEGWDALVKVLNKDGTVVAQTRTYGKAKDMEVNPGTYTLSFQALKIEGINTFFKSEKVTTSATKGAEITHEFDTGTAMIWVKSGDENIDAIVKVIEITTGQNVAGSRSYAKGCSFILNKGSYRVEVKPIGQNKDKDSQSFSMEIDKGGKIEKTLEF